MYAFEKAHTEFSLMLRRTSAQFCPISCTTYIISCHLDESVHDERVREIMEVEPALESTNKFTRRCSSPLPFRKRIEFSCENEVKYTVFTLCAVTRNTQTKANHTVYPDRRVIYKTCMFIPIFSTRHFIVLSIITL